MQPLMKTYPITAAEYLEAEKTAEVKHEFVNGYVYAMVGASRRHNLLTVSLATLLNTHLKGTRCQVFASDMKVRAGGKNDTMFFYPDVMVVCSHPSDETPKDPYVEEAPKLIIEVLSPSTEQYDRLGKLAAYTQIARLEEYLLVDQQDMLVDLYRRSGEQWQLTQLKKGDQLVLNSVELELPVADIYRDVIGVV
ncbi:Uma2 family endonuclease [Endozoicomonas sp. ONNA2]|uniref:Uma2 family endonuclease n=1 Tax=Endozoicomonas sp. ONNA2 TaxID=2828741 RepID=UPI002148CCA8|nr:Uma2 family endonuclease [Endozoicomonas sp. ONNA2]